MRRMLRHLMVKIGFWLVIGWLFAERGRLLQPSTVAFLRGLGWRSLFDSHFLHAYLYGRWTNQYIGIARRTTFAAVASGQSELDWSPVYHGKIMPTEDAKRLISIGQPVPRQDLEQIIPYATAREIVLTAHPDVALYECGCRASVENPCTPTQVCMIVGQPFVDFVVEHNPETARRVTTEEALQVLQAEHERGHIHAAYFKDVMLGRFYAICNCCPCCCGGLEAMRIGVPMVTSSGYVAQVNDEACLGCGDCADACPFEAIAIDASWVAAVDWEACMGCGVCEGACQQDVITLVRDERKGIPLDVRELVAQDNSAT